MASPVLGLFSPILVFEQGTPNLPSWSNLASLPFNCYHPKLCPLFWDLLLTLFHSFFSCLRASRGPASDSNILVATSWAQLIVPSSRYSSSLLPPMPSFSLSLASGRPSGRRARGGGRRPGPRGARPGGLLRASWLVLLANSGFD